MRCAIRVTNAKHLFLPRYSPGFHQIETGVRNIQHVAAEKGGERISEGAVPPAPDIKLLSIALVIPSTRFRRPSVQRCPPRTVGDVPIAAPKPGRLFENVVKGPSVPVVKGPSEPVVKGTNGRRGTVGDAKR
jgi:hypothetical protein